MAHKTYIIKDYEIQQGDILKVGRVKFAVKEIKLRGLETKMDDDAV